MNADRIDPKDQLRTSIYSLATTGVGERRIWGEVIAKAMVDRIRVRMPE